MLTSVAGFVLFSAGTGGMKMADRFRFWVGGERLLTGDCESDFGLEGFSGLMS